MDSFDAGLAIRSLPFLHRESGACSSSGSVSGIITIDAAATDSPDDETAERNDRLRLSVPGPGAPPCAIGHSWQSAVRAKAIMILQLTQRGRFRTAWDHSCTAVTSDTDVRENLAVENYRSGRGFIQF